MYSKLSNIINDINTVLLPQLCFGCNARLYRGEQVLCTICRNELPLTDYNFKDENAVDRIFYGRVDIIKASAFLFYSDTGIVKNLIHYLKYKEQKVISSFLGNWFGALLKERSNLPQIDAIIPVPLHKKRLKKRGYNQVDGFGQQLALHLNSRFEDKLLWKTANTRTQTKKNRQFRWQANQDLFRLHEPTTYKNKRIMLVDDIITTGATIEACVKVLEEIPGVQIYVATMAVVP